MNYEYASIPTRYSNTDFRSRLEARWAAFADLAGWQWRYEPIELVGWIPDFWFSFPCTHSECCGETRQERIQFFHELYAEVKPYRTIAEFDGHAVTKVPRYSLPSPAMFGWHPDVTEWEMVHGAGGGIYCAADWVSGDVDTLWNEAGNRTRWKWRNL